MLEQFPRIRLAPATILHAACFHTCPTCDGRFTHHFVGHDESPAWEPIPCRAPLVVWCHACMTTLLAAGHPLAPEAGAQSPS
jgi:hypothetical protein